MRPPRCPRSVQSTGGAAHSYPRLQRGPGEIQAGREGCARGECSLEHATYTRAAIRLVIEAQPVSDQPKSSQPGRWRRRVTNRPAQPVVVPVHWPVHWPEGNAQRGTRNAHQEGGRNNGG